MAFDAWLAEHVRRGVSLRFQPDERRCELRGSVAGVRRKSWLKSAAEKWTRRTRHKEFPHDALPHKKILFAIRQPCADAKSNGFFPGACDAGLVAGVGFNAAALMFKEKEDQF